jgi:transketolase
LDQNNLPELKKIAGTLRGDVLAMVREAGSGHVGGSFSVAELLTVLYFKILRIRPDDPAWDKRDRLVLSKGHAAPMLYAALARRGYFNVEILQTLRKQGSILQGHPSRKKTPGIDITTGCLGEGLSAGCGMALAAKLKHLDYRTFVILGDGELQEGQCWEAIQFASGRKLDNLFALIDNNGLMCDDPIENILPMGDIAGKWRAFGWLVEEVDGHDIKALVDVLNRCKAGNGGPKAIIFKTIKGKGVSFMENDPAWHGAIVTDQIYQDACKELNDEQ